MTLTKTHTKFQIYKTIKYFSEHTHDTTISPKTSDVEETEEIVTTFVQKPGSMEPKQIKTKKTTIRKNYKPKTDSPDEGHVIIEETLDVDETKIPQPEKLHHEVNIQEFTPDETTTLEDTDQSTIEMPEEYSQIPKMPSQVQIEEIAVEKIPLKQTKKKSTPKDTKPTKIDESLTTEEKPSDGIEFKKETIDEEMPDGKLQIKKTTKRTVKKTSGLPKTEILEDEFDQSVDDFSQDAISDTAQVIEETPETVVVSQVRSETGEVTKVEKIKKVMRKEKDGKPEVFEFSTVQKDDETPVATVIILEKKPTDEKKLHKHEDISEKTIIEEIQISEGTPKIKKTTKRTVNKAIGTPKTETIEEVLDQSVDDFLRDAIPDNAQIIELTPETIEVSQAHTDTGEVIKVKKSKKVIQTEKDGKPEIMEVSTVQKDDEPSITTLTILEEKPTSEGRPQNIAEVPVDTNVEEIHTPVGENDIKKSTKHTTKKTVGTPKTEVIEEKFDQTTDDFIDNAVSDSAHIIEETPKTAKVSQERAETEVTKFKKSVKSKPKPEQKEKDRVQIATPQQERNESSDISEEIPIKETQIPDGKSTLANVTNCISQLILTSNHNDIDITFKYSMLLHRVSKNFVSKNKRVDFVSIHHQKPNDKTCLNTYTISYHIFRIYASTHCYIITQYKNGQPKIVYFLLTEPRKTQPLISDQHL